MGSVEFSGPLPPPQIMAQYNQVLPGAAERILAMAEAEQRHRHEGTNQLIKADMGLQWTGMIFGFVLSTLTLIGGFVLIYSDKDVGGITALVLAVGGLISTSIYGHRSKPKAPNKPK